jgi:UDP-N-acetylglucosamine 2-epimerase (non-hydrolysing)
MMAFEQVLEERAPDWVVLVGDVNATCACAVTAKKQGASVAHVEAGLRSFDTNMPEEINRLVTDRLSDLLFTTDAIADENLRREGAAPERIHRAGNVMIDTLHAHWERASALNLRRILTDGWVADAPWKEEAVQRVADGGVFAALTLHRPPNVDTDEVLRALIDWFVDELSAEMPLIWPIHPRTRERLEAFGLWGRVRDAPGVLLLAPVGYQTMLKLNESATVLLTDSGGLQEECCVFGTPCLTLRWNTERPVTLREHGGVSELVGNDVARIQRAWRRVRESSTKREGCVPPLWDGRAAERTARALLGEGEPMGSDRDRE